MIHFYENIEGWFNFQQIYADAVSGVGDGSYFVEIGAYQGKSTVYMAVEILNSGKKIKFDTIDIWDNYKENNSFSNFRCINGVETYQIFLKNIEPVKNYINIVRGDSIEVSKNYLDKSVDFLYVDGSHDYEHLKKELKVWIPKMKIGGIMSGHDYESSGWRSVVDAVNETFDKEKIKTIGGNSWWIKM